MSTTDPLVPLDVDCTDLDGFMLNVERLMASELVALSSHEVIGAALLLWCRAWKQRPAASLPNDEKVIAAFARMPLTKFRRLRDEVMRGFVLCSDGRLYHSTLATEALKAYARKVAFQKRRETDAERLRNWRSGKRNETRSETQSETRFVQEGQGVDREWTGSGQGHGSPPSAFAPGGEPLSSAASPPPYEPAPPAEIRPASRRNGVASPKVAPPTEAETALQAACRRTWASYATAYRDRYGTDPVRNAKINAMVRQLVQRLGNEDSPIVAAWFLGHSDAWYVRKGHDFGLLLGDCEKLRTEWATGRTVTATQAMQSDRTAANLASHNGALEILRAKGLA